MSDDNMSKQNLVLACWYSYRSMPVWVQIWVAFILVPVNMASLFFIAQPGGMWVAILANVAMVLNLPVMVYERGFTKLMAVPHLIPWTILVVYLALARPDAAGIYDIYLWVLLVTNVISLAFDYPDAVKWMRGER